MNPPTRKDKLLEKWITAIGTKIKGICTLDDTSQRGKLLKVICAKESGVRIKFISEACEKSENILVLRIYPSEQLIAHKHILSLVHSPK